MSKYTTELRYICETLAGVNPEGGEYANVEAVIEGSRAKIFDFDYPIFDENYRNTLENKILLHYYTQEIGLETVGLWKLRLRAKLNEIMPYYNQLYKSELLEFNPLVDVDLSTTRTNTGKNTSSSDYRNDYTGNQTLDSDREDVSYNLFSDTPQGALTGVDSEEYLSSANKVKNTGNTSTTNSSKTASNGYTSNNINTIDQYIEHISGKNGGENYAKKLTAFRKTFLNIDMEVINELRNLFMLVW